MDRTTPFASREMRVEKRPGAKRLDPSFGSRLRTNRKADQPVRFVVAPLVPLVAALAFGIVIDRFVDPCDNQHLGQAGAGVRDDCGVDDSLLLDLFPCARGGSCRAGRRLAS